eukprot:gene17049-18766_t
MATLNDQLSIRRIRPCLEKSKAIELARKHFGLNTVNKIKELVSYDDRNFFIEGSYGCSSEYQSKELEEKKCVLKIMNSDVTYRSDILDAVMLALQHFKRFLGHRYSCPLPVQTSKGALKELANLRIQDGELSKLDPGFLKNKFHSDYVHFSSDESGKTIVEFKHYVRVWERGQGHTGGWYQLRANKFNSASSRTDGGGHLEEFKGELLGFKSLLTYVPGSIYPGGELNEDLLIQAGKLAANTVKCFKDFSHPALVAKHDKWDVKNFLLIWTPQYLDPIKNQSRREKVEIAFKMFEKHVVPVLKDLPMQTIHSDISEQNIIVDKNETGRWKITGLIDFVDIRYSCRIFEIGICIAYLGQLNVSEFNWVAGNLLTGYLSEETLTELELSILYHCVLGRLVTSLVVGNYQYSLCDSQNDYLLLTQKTGWDLLDVLLESKDSFQQMPQVWLSSCNKDNNCQ